MRVASLGLLLTLTVAGVSAVPRAEVGALFIPSEKSLVPASRWASLEIPPLQVGVFDLGVPGGSGLVDWAAFAPRGAWFGWTVDVGSLSTQLSVGAAPAGVLELSWQGYPFQALSDVTQWATVDQRWGMVRWGGVVLETQGRAQFETNPNVGTLGGKGWVAWLGTAEVQGFVGEFTGDFDADLFLIVAHHKTSGRFQNRIFGLRATGEGRDGTWSWGLSGTLGGLWTLEDRWNIDQSWLEVIFTPWPTLVSREDHWAYEVKARAAWGLLLEPWLGYDLAPGFTLELSPWVAAAGGWTFTDHRSGSTNSTPWMPLAGGRVNLVTRW